MFTVESADGGHARELRIDALAVESIMDRGDGTLIVGMRSGQSYRVRGKLQEIAEKVDAERKRQDDDFSPFIFTDMPIETRDTDAATKPKGKGAASRSK